MALFAMLSLGLMSCEDADVSDTEEAWDLEASELVPDGYSYFYHGQKYSYPELKKVSNGTESMIALNDLVFVFDSELEAKAFDAGEFQAILGAYKAQREIQNPSVRALAVGETVWGDAHYRLRLYEHKNYTGRVFYSYRIHSIGHKRTMIGYEWVNAHYETNLPTDYRKIATSYKMEYLTVPKIDGYWMVLEMKLRTGLLGADRNVNWTKKLYQNPEMGTSWTVEQDPDLSNNRIWAQLGIGTWNDQIQSFSIDFNSY